MKLTPDVNVIKRFVLAIDGSYKISWSVRSWQTFQFRQIFD